jgi:hypothetical protein
MIPKNLPKPHRFAAAARAVKRPPAPHRSPPRPAAVNPFEKSAFTAPRKNYAAINPPPAPKTPPKTDGAPNNPATAFKGRSASKELPKVTGPENSMTVVNRSKEPQTYNFYKNKKPGEPGSDVSKSITLKPGEHQTVKLPTGWSGYMQKFNGNKADPHSRVEVAYNQFKGKTFSNLSFEDGFNGPAKIRSQSGDRVTGTSKNLVELAKQNGVRTARDSSGKEVLGAAELPGDVPNKPLVNFYRNHLKKGEGYVQNFDNESSGGGQDNHLIVEMG